MKLLPNTVSVAWLKDTANVLRKGYNVTTNSISISNTLTQSNTDSFHFFLCLETIFSILFPPKKAFLAPCAWRTD
ncbi:hypothetical protein D3C78_711930 [compost metagenome]